MLELQCESIGKYNLPCFVQNVSGMHLIDFALATNLATLFVALSFSLNGRLTLLAFLGPAPAHQGHLCSVVSSSGLHTLSSYTSYVTCLLSFITILL